MRVSTDPPDLLAPYKIIDPVTPTDLLEPQTLHVKLAFYIFAWLLAVRLKTRNWTNVASTERNSHSDSDADCCWFKRHTVDQRNFYSDYSFGLFSLTERRTYNYLSFYFLQFVTLVDGFKLPCSLIVGPNGHHYSCWSTRNAFMQMGNPWKNSDEVSVLFLHLFDQKTFPVSCFYL